jgi:hypothetical protein
MLSIGKRVLSEIYTSFHPNIRLSKFFTFAGKDYIYENIL